ncbi:MAG TPA: hypothetical protein VMI94_09405 [Bryobacteraceae bacterium]|nr:hypothetical protein [Bryobacteraceae bacterium]
MARNLRLGTLLLAFAAATPAQNFRLGVDSSELIPTGALTVLYKAPAATDAAGAIYILESGAAGVTYNATAAYYLTKLDQNGVVYQNLLPFAPLLMAVDPGGSVYLVATSSSSPDWSAVKLGADGSTVVYSTDLGPAPQVTGLAVDAAGRAYIAGIVQGNGIQTTPGVLQPAPADSSNTASNAFVMRLTPTGAVDYATYLGGASQADTSAIAVDASGSVFVTGFALSASFPTTAGAYLDASGISNFSGAPFLARLSSDGSALLYSTFMRAGYYPNYIVVDSAGNAVVASTVMNSLTATGSLVARFNAQGTAVAFSTAVPASSPSGLAVDAAGNTYLAVNANGNYPPLNSLSGCETQASAALTVLDSRGEIVQSTYVPGASLPGPFAPFAMVLEPDSTVFVVAPPDASFVPTKVIAGSSGGILSLTSLSPNAAAPVVQLACITNAASYDSAGISGGEIVSLFGQGLGPALGAQPQDLRAGYANQLAGVQVTFNDIPGPLLYVQDAQINAIAPWALQAGDTVRVCVSYQGTATNCVTRPVVDQHPGVFTLDGTYAAALNQDGSFNSPSNPAPVGSIVSVFATGLGPINPPQPDGAFVGLPLPSNTLADFVYYLYDTFFIGTISVPCEVTYAGPAPFEVAGVSQINFVVADTSTSYGFVAPFILQAGGTAPAGVTYGSGGNGFLVHVIPQQ